MRPPAGASRVSSSASPLSISHIKWRNPLPLWSSSQRPPSYHHKSLLSRPCSLYHRLPASVLAMSSSPKKAIDLHHHHYRLPKDVRPRHYDLTVRTDLEKEKFAGFVKIEIDIVDATKKVTFSAADELILGPATLVVASSNAELRPVGTYFERDTQQVSLTFADELAAGTKATLRIGFEGTLTDSLTGYYKSTWEKGTYALTQFEPTDARRALPCWDEPHLKTTISVTLISRKGTVNLSNMPARSDVAVADTLTEHLFEGVNDGSWHATSFETTPPISTYLLAYANGEFSYIEGSYKSPLSGKIRPLRVYSTPNVIHQAQYALEIKRDVLPLYEQAFDIEYPLPKLDTLLVHDFDIGAMENWGLITGRTLIFLLDSENADFFTKKRIAGLLSHEVAHMWFGNITTPKWWNDVYLNEGFATLMGESIILNRLHPTWNVDAAFINEHLNIALRLDAKLSSHPIEVAVPDAGQIGQIFDALSYSKAASVLRMLSRYVSEDKFLKGVSLYLKKHLYSNTVSRDLWEGIGEATGLDIPKLMDNWVLKMGFPVLTVSETPTGIKVRQDRFLETGPAKPEDNETIWSAPLGLITESVPGQALVDSTALLETREAEFKLDTTKPFKINADTSGVYRVLYTPPRLLAIAKEAGKANSIFSLDDRIGLVSDAFALAKAGYLSLSATLNLVHELRADREFLTWDSIDKNLTEIIHTWYEDEKVTQGLKAFRRALTSPIVKELGVEYSKNDSPEITQLRTLAVDAASLTGDPPTVKALLERFSKYISGDTSAIPADLLGATFRTAVEHTGSTAYDALLKIFENPATSTIKIAAIRGLTAAVDPALQERTFNLIQTSVRNQDLVYFFRRFGANPTAIVSLRDFFEKNYDSIYTRLEKTVSMKYIIQYVYTNFAKDEDRSRTEEFFKDKDTRRYNQSVAQALDEISAKAALIKRSTSDVLEWLEERERQ